MKKLLFLTIMIIPINIFTASFNVTNLSGKDVIVKTKEKHRCIYLKNESLSTILESENCKRRGTISKRALKVIIKIGDYKLEHLIGKYEHFNFVLESQGLKVREVINHVESQAIFYPY